jgi:hypothetical protein
MLDQLPSYLQEQAKRQLQADTPKPTTVVSLVVEAKAVKVDLRQIDKTIIQAEGKRTALHCRYGKILAAIKDSCEHGQWLPTLADIGESEARSLEYIKVFQFFSDFGKIDDLTAEAEAGRHTVKQSFVAIRRDPRFYNVYENCFETPQWLRDVITKQYGFPGLDVAASHGKHLGERWYAPRQFDEDGNLDPAGVGAIGFDALKQDWVKDCPKGKVAWCNAPYFKDVLHAFLEMCYSESQRGLTVVGFSPCWSEWHKDLINKYAEVRHCTKRVVCDGFGPKDGKQVCCKRNDGQVFVFRPGQTYFRGLDISPIEETPEPIGNPPEDRPAPKHCITCPYCGKSW